MMTINLTWVISLLMVCLHCVCSQEASAQVGSDQRSDPEPELLTRHSNMRTVTKTPEQRDTEPALNRFHCFVSESEQLTMGASSLREVEYDLKSAFVHLLSLLKSLDNIGVEKFEQNQDPKNVYARSNSVWLSGIFGDLTRAHTIDLLFRPLLESHQHILHNSRRLRIKNGEDQFNYCQFDQLELINDECSNTLNATCLKFSWAFPSDPELKENQAVTETLIEDSTSRLQWITLSEEESSGQEYITIAREEALLLWSLKDLILQQIRNMQSKIDIFDTLVFIPHGIRCNYWTLISSLALAEESMNSLSEDNARDKEKACRDLQSRIDAVSRGKRGLFELFFRDYGSQINSIFKTQRKLVHSSNTLNHNQRSIIENMKILQSNLKSLEGTDWANVKALERSIKIVQSRNSFHDEVFKESQSRNAFLSYLLGIYSQVVAILGDWERTLTDALAESASGDKCNLAPDLNRVVCKKGRGFLQKIHNGTLRVITRGENMDFKTVLLPQCLLDMSGVNDRIFRGNHYAFLAQGETWVHENVTLPRVCNKKGGDKENVYSCDSYLVDVEEVQHPPPAKQGKLFYLMIDDGISRGVYLQSRSPLNVLGPETSQSVHSTPSFYPEKSFPIHLDGVKYDFEDFGFEHRSFSHKFFLDMHQPNYFKHSQEVRITTAALEKAGWKELMIRELRSRFLKSDPIFLSTLSVSSLFIFVLLVLMICCIRKKCCNKELKTREYVTYYKGQAVKASRGWFGRKKQEKQSKVSQDTEELQPFKMATAPTMNEVAGDIRQGRVVQPSGLGPGQRHVGGRAGLPAPRLLPKPGRGVVKDVNKGQLEEYVRIHRAGGKGSQQ